jgi:hypothetical protein
LIGMLARGADGRGPDIFDDSLQRWADDPATDLGPAAAAGRARCDAGAGGPHPAGSCCSLYRAPAALMKGRRSYAPPRPLTR